MFSDLFNLAKQRTTKEAFGFYIAYAILTLIALFVMGIITALVMGEAAVMQAQRMGQIAAVIIPLALSFMIIGKKQAMSFKNVIIALLSAIMGLMGIFVGLIPTAYLTTEPNYAAPEDTQTPRDNEQHEIQSDSDGQTPQ